MDEIKRSIEQTKAGDINAFGVIVTRFQDMALGYALSILHDLQLAQDAAQEAFIAAYLNLDSLRDPQSLPAWLRRIVFTQCTRIRRRKQPASIDPQTVDMEATEAGPEELFESAQQRRIVAAALRSLPERSQEILALFYISGYSYAEVADMLTIPVSTVKKRLHDGRKLMKQRMTEMAELAEEDFQPLRPSRSKKFSTDTVDAIRSALEAMAAGDVARLEQLLQKHPALVESSGFDDTEEGTYFHGAALLHYVAGNPTDHPVPKNAAAATRLLLKYGADPNSMTDVGNNTPLCLVASGRAAREVGVQIELIDILVEAGAEVDASDGLAIYAALIHGETDASRALFKHGARLDLGFAAGLGEIGVMASFVADDGTLKADARRSHSRRPYYERNVEPPRDSPSSDADSSEPPAATDATLPALPRMTDAEILGEALAYAVANQQLEAMRWLLDHGADPNVKPARFHGGQSVLHLVCCNLGQGNVEAAKMLLDAGADADDNDPESTGATPLQWAVHNGQPAPISMLLGCTDSTAAVHVHYAIKCLLENDTKQRTRRLKVVEELLKNGATPAVARGDGRTAADVVETSGDVDLQRLFAPGRPVK